MKNYTVVVPSLMIGKSQKFKGDVVALDEAQALKFKGFVADKAAPAPLHVVKKESDG